MKSFESMRTRAAVHFIITAIVLCFAAFFYVKFYYAFRSGTGSIIDRVKANLTTAIIFFALSAVWLINWFSVNVKYSRIRRIYGAYFGGILGRILLLVELVGWGLALAFLVV